MRQDVLTVDDVVSERSPHCWGTAANQVRIEHVAVNPASGKAHISVSRG